VSLLRLAIAGAGGRMGRALLEAAATTPGCCVAAALEAPGSPFVGRDAGEFEAGAKGTPIGSDIAAAVASCDTLIDFTRPAGTLAHLAACVSAGKSLVIGTTGFEPHELVALRAGAARIPVLLAPNFSIGVNVTLKLVELASRALGSAYDVEVFEMHHKLKVDAPSGTALKLGEVAAKARGTTLERDGVFARHGVTGERKDGTIGFSVARGGDVIGDHTVFFVGTGERIEITHRSNSRATYAQGAIRAARWLVGKPPGLYGMDDVLGIKS
jgi:4-hydroxy-tetrahydrodipicolinate reductase